MSSFNIFTAPLEGTHLIDASAGTGKTHTISDLVLRLLIEKNVPISSILVVTYTEAATKELREKVRNKILEAHAIFQRGRGETPFYEKLLRDHPNHQHVSRVLREALRGFDEAAVFTIHGFCQRILWEHNLETGTLFDTELVVDERPLLQEIVEDFIRCNLYGASQLFVMYAVRLMQVKMLLGLLQRYGNKPGLKIMPDLFPAAIVEELAAAEQAFTEKYRALRICWHTDRQDIRECLYHPDLNKNKYRPDSVSHWMSAMDGMLVSEGPIVDFFEQFDKFTTAAINAAVKQGGSPPEHSFFRLAQDLSESRKQLVGIYDQYLIFLKKELLAFAGRQLLDRKQTLNLHSFDDLLLYLRNSLLSDSGSQLAAAIRKKYPVAMIDEFQDTDVVQYQIFERIYRNGRDELLMFIGDPKQSIYSFRGADIFTYIMAARHARSHSTLGENWRSSPQLVNAVNTLFSRSQRVVNPFLFQEIEFTEVAPADRADRKELILNGLDPAPLQIWLLERPSGQEKQISKEAATEMACKAVAHEIAVLLNAAGQGNITIGSEPVAPGDIAILVRTNRQARKMQEMLQSVGLSGVLHSSGNVFDSREAHEMRLFLQACEDPKSEKNVRAALATEMIGFAGRNLDLLYDESPELEGKRADIYDFHALWQTGGFMSMFVEFLDRQGIRERLLGLYDGERRITNILHLMELLHRVEQEYDYSPPRLVQYLVERMADKDAAEEYQLRLESDADRIKIVTVHKAKGLQYPVVFCPFMWEGINVRGNSECLFHSQDDAVPVLDLGSDKYDSHNQQAQWELLAEDIRLLYVALTRAEYRCYLCWGGIRQADMSALSYLLHKHNSVIEAVDLAQLRYFAKMGDGEILKDLQRLEMEANNTIRICRVGPLVESVVLPVHKLNQIGTCRKFSRLLDSQWQISSFSSIISKRAKTYVERPGVVDSLHFFEGSPFEGNSKEEATIFTFPKGAAAGTFLHEILEGLDFSVDQTIIENMVREKLARYEYEANWLEPLCTMFDHVVQVPLLAALPDMTLKKIGRHHKKAEMEFYFPLGLVEMAKIQELFCASHVKQHLQGFAEKLKNLSEVKLAGFMKGFIDLFFEYEGKYYLVDWKSNHLGGGLHFYGPDQLLDVMQEEMYVLQYHIYILALHRFLKSRLRDYAYEKNFGGVFYIFLRGVNKNIPQSGVFFDRPEYDFISKLEDSVMASVR